MIMDKKIYKKIADMHKAEESRGKNALVAFIVGGIVGKQGMKCYDSKVIPYRKAMEEN